MEGVRGSDHNPGQFRTAQNQIGRPARFVPSPATRLPAQLNDFEKYLHADRVYDPLVEAFLVHYQFEAIHPFMDGNGRVGGSCLPFSFKSGADFPNNGYT